jgi:tRNA pseudouridine38-40 synthase
VARNLKIILAYHGAPFAGWQIQPERTTVQGTLAEAIFRLTGERRLPQGSGRTDAGVHALAQVASLELDSPIPAQNLKKALNHILPPQIRVLEVEDAPPGFHARHSAKAKTYCYRIFRGEICPPFLANLVTHYPYPLHEAAMISAAAEVEGEHDFTSFAASDPDRTRRIALGQNGEEDEDDAAPSNVRTIYSSQWAREGDELVYQVRGNGFLHHMVRNLVGTFLLVGKETLKPWDIRRILARQDRSAAGPTAPAEGLYLVSVEY